MKTNLVMDETIVYSFTSLMFFADFNPARY